LDILIRNFEENDAEALEAILKLNGQFDYPEIENRESMIRVSNCEAAIFLVAELDKSVCGCLKAIYDGSRALIHLVSVHPDYQSKGIATKLVDIAINKLSGLGAPSVSVTVSDESQGYWKKLGFSVLPVYVMLKNT